MHKDNVTERTVHEIPTNMCFRICVYPSDETRHRLVAHCLELDVIGTGDSVQEALETCVELIEVQINAAREFGTQLLFSAPRHVWAKYQDSRSRSKRIRSELIDRVLSRTEAPFVETVLPSSDLPPEYMACV